tara:strand:+ start:6024 stop:6515 length:492 start_codon:yes stop_codon:yes gene_type:complete
MKRVTFIGLLLIVLLSSCSSNPARFAPDAKVIKPIKIQKVNKMVGILPTVELSQGPETAVSAADDREDVRTRRAAFVAKKTAAKAKRAAVKARASYEKRSKELAEKARSNAVVAGDKSEERVKEAKLKKLYMYYGALSLVIVLFLLRKITFKKGTVKEADNKK